MWLGVEGEGEVADASGIMLNIDDEVPARGHFAEGGTGGSGEQARHYSQQGMPPQYYQQQGFPPYMQHGHPGHGHPGMGPFAQHPGVAPFQSARGQHYMNQQAYGQPPYQGGSMPYQGGPRYQGAHGPSIYQDPWSGGGGPGWGARQPPGYRDFASWAADRDPRSRDDRSKTSAPATEARDRNPPWGVNTRDWEVALDRRGQDLGIDVLQVGNMLSVSRVKPGPVKTFNQSNRDLRINVGDNIVAVNGAIGSCEAIIGAIKNNQKLTFRVSRLLEFGATIVKRNTLGLDVAHAGSSLRILRVGDGPFREWNSGAGNDDTVIRYGDLCIEVNKVRGRSQDLLAAIKAVNVGEELSLLFSRCVYSRHVTNAGGPGGAQHKGSDGQGSQQGTSQRGSQDEHDEDDSYELDEETSPDQTPEPSPRVSPDPSPKMSPEASPRGGHIALPIPD